MDDRHKPPNRSASMPLFREYPQSPKRVELQAWQRSVEVAQRAVEKGVHAHIFQGFVPFARMYHTDARVPHSMPSSMRPSGPVITADAFGSPQGLKGLYGTAMLHQRRMASMPSSQYVGQMDNQMSPVSKRCVPRGQEMAKIPAMFQQYHSDEEKRNSERVVGLNKENGGFAGFGIPQPSPRSFNNTPGHGRQPTDPFVDYTPEPSSRILQPSNQYLVPGQSSVGASRFTAGLPSPASAFAQNLVATQPLPQVFYNTEPNTPAWPSSAPPTFTLNVPPNRAYAPSPSPHVSARPSLPIPPPPLPSLGAHYTQDPTGRARLDSQKSVRETWIRTEATKIAQLSRLRHQAEQLYTKTQTQEDFELWQKASAAFAEATSLEKRQEERRALLLKDRDMLPLTTTRKEDMSAAMRELFETAGVDGGERKLLGFVMALMERVCAEVKDGEGHEGGISADMLATLSLEEKKELRKHLVGRLQKVQK
ncbi:hypothetical protein A1F94_000325 [Pyrenophora tritici-repentis]|nr:hypothetical protein A1F94_000325 [Pyrenophora tritici-repentis]KAI0580051.1 hypothetical protein Alg215_05449 [Pyrenophora tritici-repentis]KAI0590584.1 hypothetical protein Alg130_02100 [Pyrenophora tritici-repentis]KAI0613562.1 hypothetical protein TUN205_02172 [Pyrenophora tritici-repentis]KAI0621262.1 hypothetical protein TUN199_06755 [Pyrenophora tritici-repentis]